MPRGQYSEAETALYDRALVETVRYVVGVAAELPRFQSELAAQQLQRLSGLQSDVGEILTRIKRVEVFVQRAGVDAKQQRYEADYRQAVLRKFDTMELFGADIAPESRRHSLSVAFVSLRLERLDGHEDESVVMDFESIMDSNTPDDTLTLPIAMVGHSNLSIRSID